MEISCSEKKVPASEPEQTPTLRGQEEEEKTVQETQEEKLMN